MMTVNGLKVQFTDSLLFPSGSADVSLDGEIILGQLVSILSVIKNKYSFTIEGHADSRPIKNKVLDIVPSIETYSFYVLKR